MNTNMNTTASPYQPVSNYHPNTPRKLHKNRPLMKQTKSSPFAPKFFPNEPIVSDNYNYAVPTHSRSRSHTGTYDSSSSNWTALIPPLPKFPSPQQPHSDEEKKSLPVPHQRHSIAISPVQTDSDARLDDIFFVRQPQPAVTKPQNFQPKFHTQPNIDSPYRAGNVGVATGVPINAPSNVVNVPPSQQDNRLSPYSGPQSRAPSSNAPFHSNNPSSHVHNHSNHHNHSQHPQNNSSHLQHHSISANESFKPQTSMGHPPLIKQESSNSVVGTPHKTGDKKLRRRKKICKACGLEITGQFVRALSNAYHVECFTCNECGKQCATKFFPFEKVNEELGVKLQVALCEYDYFKKLDLICFSCNTALRGPYITALGNKYHLEHFKCAVCQKVFESDESYYEHESNIYCHYHYSKLYASHCEGCQSSIVKQFVELFRGGRNEQWHPECYMVHKFWSVCIRGDSVGLSPKITSRSNENISSEVLVAAEQQIEAVVMGCWLTLSGYEELTASCISDMLLHACTLNQSSGLRASAKLILYLELLFVGIDHVTGFCQSLRLEVKRIDPEGVEEYFQKLHKEPRNISGKIMSYLAILRKAKQIQLSGSLSSELLSVITSCAHYLKLLIRIGLNNALKANKITGTTNAFDVFMADVKKYEQYSLVGQEKVDEIIEKNLKVHPSATDACQGCQKSIEQDCVMHGQRRWHIKCFNCSKCSQKMNYEDNSILVSCGYNAINQTIFCEECISDERDAKPGFIYVSTLSQLIYLLKIAFTRSNTLMARNDDGKGNLMNTIEEDQNRVTELNYSKTLNDVTRLRSKRQSQKLSNSIKQKGRKSVIIEAPEAVAAKEEEQNEDDSLDFRMRTTSVSSQLSYVSQEKESDQFKISRKRSLKIRDEPQRQLTNSHLDRTSDLLKNEKSLTLDDIPRIVAAEQAREQRPNAFKHHNSLYQYQKPMQPVKTVAAANGRNGSLNRGGNELVAVQRKNKYFSELSKSEHFVLRHIAVEALVQLLGNKYNKEELLNLIQTRKQPTFWDKFKFGGEPRKDKNLGIFGVDLQEITNKYGVDSDLGVGPSKLRIPIVVDDIINALRQKDMSVEGIFRLNGNIKKLKELTEEINKNPTKSPDFSTQTAIQLAALMKKWLRDLPNPLLTFNFYDLWISSYNEQNPQLRKRLVHLIYAMLPRSHRNLLEVLLYFFSWVASFAEIDESTGSKMDIHNLSTVIAPNILYAKLKTGDAQISNKGDSYFLAIEVVNQLIENHEELTVIPQDLLEFFEVEGFNKLSELITTKEIMNKLEKVTKDQPPFFLKHFRDGDQGEMPTQEVGTNTITRGHSQQIVESHGETSVV